MGMKSGGHFSESSFLTFTPLEVRKIHREKLGTYMCQVVRVSSPGGGVIFPPDRPWDIPSSFLYKEYQLYLISIYLLTAIGFSPGGSSTVHIYTKTIHRTTQNKQYIEQHNNLGECGPCLVLASYTLAFALQLRKKHGKSSVRVAESRNT